MPALSELPRVMAWGTVRAPFRDRVAAAAGAGFKRIGLMLGEYLALRTAGWSDTALRQVLDEHSVAISEVEVLFGFAARSGPAGVAERPGLVYNDPELERAAFHLADVFGVPTVQVAGTFAAPPPAAGVAEAFGSLCDRAATHGMRVALEFVPYTDIPDVVTAGAIVAEAGRPNGGLCVDSWHFYRGRPDLAALGAVPADRILMIQVNDGPLRPDDANRRRDAVHNRRLPGEGEFDLLAWLLAMDRPGLDASVSVEVYSDTLARLEPAEAACRAFNATRDLLAKADHR
ncbi:MAG: sugar phosphate isomerase/epimerase [Trebonia sp.]